MNGAQIKHMVDRFLGWKLPATFNPDCGIQFDADAAKKLDPRNHRYEPVGTNLFSATEADAMVRHMLEGLPAEKNGNEFAWLIEAPGPRYLAVMNVPKAHFDFAWTQDHNKALRFYSKEQAEALMLTVRQADREADSKANGGKLSWGNLFGFETTLGNARAVEHGWMVGP